MKLHILSNTLLQEIKLEIIFLFANSKEMKRLKTNQIKKILFLRLNKNIFFEIESKFIDKSYPRKEIPFYIQLQYCFRDNKSYSIINVI